MVAHVYSPYDKSYPHHYVLVTGYDTEDSSIYYVNDPFYEKTTYSVDKIAGYCIFILDVLTQAKEWKNFTFLIKSSNLKFKIIRKCFFKFYFPRISL